jgi:hypothetical protein
MSKHDKNAGYIQPTGEDLLRGLGYLVIMAWAVLFFFYPPTAFVSSLDILTRALWLGLTFLGGFAALMGSLTRYDIKMELPGLAFVHVGPLLYFLSQIYYVSFPEPGVNEIGRVALIAYAILPGILLLPRTCSLFVAAMRLKKVNQNTQSLDAQLNKARTTLSENVGVGPLDTVLTRKKGTK